MTWKEIQPAEAKEGDRVRLGENTFPIQVAREDNLRIRYEHGTMWVNGFMLMVLGAVFEREESDRPDMRITGEMLERAANAIHTSNGWDCDYSDMPAEYREVIEADAKAVLEAALGGDQ